MKPHDTRVSYRLDGTRALVTGSASGIGFETALLLAASGASVAMNDLPGVNLERAVRLLQDKDLDVHAAPGDLSVAANARSVGRAAATRLGGMDFLINNAGAPLTREPIPASNLEALTEDFWDRILRINLLSIFWLTKELSQELRAAKGAVVNTASISAFGGGASSSAYATAKAGLVGLTRELARALAPEVRVNAIAPGYVNSNWECSFGDVADAARRELPLARVGEPGDYADVIVYLCAGARYITGEIIPVTGGMRV